jgi:hypothetical protein
MRKLFALALSLFFSMGTALAALPNDADPKPAKAATPAKPKPAKKAEKSDSAIAAEIEELRQAIQSQQEQLQLLKEELGKRDRQIDEAREAAAAANARATEASTKAAEAVNTTAEVKSTAATLNTTVSDLKASNEALKTTVATEQAEAQKAAEEGPMTIRYKGVSITPGGFIEAATVFRSRNDNSDINTDFAGIPYPGNANSKVHENNFTGRQSRLSVLVETKTGVGKVSAYYEGDFLNAGVTSNNRQSNSYPFRQRQAWASVKFDSGLYVAGGQMWSLVTESKKGIENRQEAFPLMIDPQYIVGWAWQRAYGFRVAQNWDKLALGFSLEGPQTTIGGRNFPSNFFVNAPGDAAGLYNSFDPTGYTVNKSPDILVKATLDPGWGHYEVVGIVSPFRSRTYPCGALPLPTFPTATCTSATSVAGAYNSSRAGGGAGFTARFPVFAKKVDLAVHVQGGDGIGRYSSAQLKDVTVRPDGTLVPIHSYAYLGMLEAHPSPKLDLYAYYGGEYAGRTAYVITNSAGAPFAIGYGSPLFNNSGCSTETAPTGTATNPSPGAGGSCAGDIHHIIEGTLGFWHKFFQGPKGRMQWGIQYSYFGKYGWSGDNTTASSITGAAGSGAGGSQRPKAVENMVLTSFRFYIP